MATVVNLKPENALASHLEFLYGKETGWVYAPIKTVEMGVWHEEFTFRWPQDKQKIIDHVQRHRVDSEVYLAPALFSTASNDNKDVKGSFTVWVDFDDGVPSADKLEELGIPYPSKRVLSSRNKEHWYWHLSQFCDDLKTLQDINKALCYALGGDVGCWNGNRVLRPVASFNHKRGGNEVVDIEYKAEAYGAETFSKVPVPEDSFPYEKLDVSSVPNPMQLMLKYPINKKELRDLLLRPKIKEGSRSSALMRLAYSLCELGMDNSEAYSLIKWCDDRWGKFSGRENAEKYYCDMINKARQKAPYKGMKDVKLGTGLQLYGFLSLIQHTDPTKYIIEGILPETGLMFVAGQADSGKTLLTTRWCINLALGIGLFSSKENPMGDLYSTFQRQLKIGFLSLEMPRSELVERWVGIKTGLTEQEQNVLEENFLTYAESEPVRMWDIGNLSKLISTIEANELDILLIDSATVSLSRNLNDQETVQASLDNMRLIRQKTNTAMMVISHTRKQPPGHGHKEVDLADMFGSQAMAAAASSVLGVTRDKESSTLRMNLNWLKTRHRGSSEKFTAELISSTFDFKRPTFGELVAAAPDIPQQKNGTKKRDLFDL